MGSGPGAGRGAGARGLHPQASEELLREHYAELRGRPFFGRLLDYMRSGPVVAMVRNLVHGSDSPESARREIALWFGADELLCGEDGAARWLHE
ncbi:PREDICTED: nucleoside diphosphate kinase 3 [Dipodomys ordii]|uniref:Nucleoside diphosphate kinase n=1 Tax=Dipodomys ordii TaxID=10020 RepID=A0A1S3EQP7_DIPOR|nr:PREDICTED: nucleoside diphosphate kinase 3 [Dipodomys ordii]